MTFLMRKFIWSNHLDLLLMMSMLKYVVCKSHYGLRQFPRAWFGRFSFVVRECGLHRS